MSRSTISSNNYQIRKARRICIYLQNEAAKMREATSPFMLAKIVALLSNDEWRTVAFAAGVPVADIPCKAVVLAMLRNCAPRLIGRK